MEIIAFGASISKHSINKSFATYTARQFENDKIEILDLNDFPLPLFSVDIEKEKGIPQGAKEFYKKLQLADLIIISLAEHNGTYTAAFKSLLDWVSRYNMNMFANKKVLLVSTSPGVRGGLGSMEAALLRFPRHGAEIIGNFSLPKFKENFDLEEGIINLELKTAFDKMISEMKTVLHSNSFKQKN